MNKPEYMEFRCCMCPNSDKQKPICPPNPPSRNETIPCRFVKTYIDNRGWLYKVGQGIGYPIVYKGLYQKPGKRGWKSMASLVWKSSFDDAQSDLNALAKSKGWDEHQEVSDND